MEFRSKKNSYRGKHEFLKLWYSSSPSDDKHQNVLTIVQVDSVRFTNIFNYNGRTFVGRKLRFLISLIESRLDHSRTFQTSDYEIRQTMEFYTNCTLA